MNDTTFDYIVVGAGSAGSVVASRLSEDGRNTVLLLDAGPADTSIWSKIPIGFGKMIFDSKYMWFHESEPEPFLNGRQLPLAHGKMIGGSSAVNGLVYMRGIPLDYSTWRDLGATGWGYHDNLPYFRRFERYEGGESPYHGAAGPIGVEKVRWRTSLADAIIGAGEQIGLARNDDFAGAEPEGIGYYDLTSWKGRRASVSECYIKPVKRRKNLVIEPEARATRIGFEQKRAATVTYKKNGQMTSVRARREIILCAGALQTPHLLQHSGIGPAARLRAFDVDVVHDLPGVGSNLMDHAGVGFGFTTTSRGTLNFALGSPFQKAMAGLSYLMRRTGPLSIGAAQVGALFRSRPNLEHPDIQMGIVPFLPDEKEAWKLGTTSGFRLVFYQLRPESRGDVRIASPDVLQEPQVRFNHLSAAGDTEALISAAQMMRKMIKSPSLRPYNVQEQTSSSVFSNRSDLIAYFRETALTAFHLSGSARMGVDEMAVVSPRLCVAGVEGLRVIDASVMPTIVSGNTNAATIMIAEKGSDFILGRA